MSGSRSVLVVEYFCAGGGGSRIAPGVRREARAILEALLSDFAAVPGVRVVTLRRPGLDLPLPPPHEARSVPAGPDPVLMAALRGALRGVEAALVVAPERDGVLLRLTRAVEASGALNLGASSEAVRIASDKWITWRALARAGIPQPHTTLAPSPGAGPSNGKWRRWLAALPAGAGDSGWILKPRDGYACIGVRAVPPAPGGRRDPGPHAAARLAVRKVRGEERRGNLLIQEQRLGIDASVCLIGDGRRATPLCLNAQRVVRRAERGGTQRLEYTGGATPLDHPLERRALAAAHRVARAIPGLRGYFGVDLIIERNRVWVVDVNPRLTSSYVGLRRVAAGNPAAWILDADRRRALPRRVRLRGRVEF